ncbi:hypothetical protein [Teredinibacter purpureus]|uniref:hypothetical protein n=1 Tax=Teredinibacter purpureus TaxID=2731756 RepID=UPI0005F7CEA6|nr:hypothetical protein [Teredinibacter purpureus]
MKFKQVLTIIVAIQLLGCKSDGGEERVKWEGPIAGDSNEFNQTKIDQWKILTFPDGSPNFILVNKSNGPTFSYDSLGANSTIMVHQPSGSGQSSIDVIDLDNDGIFDSIKFFSSADGDEFVMHEARLVNGNWVLNEHRKK